MSDFDLVSFLELVSLTILWAIFWIEMKEYLIMGTRLKSANNLVGSQNHTEYIHRRAELHAIYLAISILVFFLLVIFTSSTRVN
jgi:hypothetical protein